MSLSLRAASQAVIDTSRGTKRVAREERQAGASGPGKGGRGILDPKLLRGACRRRSASSILAQLIRNPVMFVVELTAALVTLVFLADVVGAGGETSGEVGRTVGFEFQIGLWLWFTVLFATFAEAIAEARGRAQAATLRKTRSETKRPSAACRRDPGRGRLRLTCAAGTSWSSVRARPSPATATSSRVSPT